MTVNTQGAEQALIDKLKAKNKQLKSTLAESVSLVADQHAKIERLEADAAQQRIAVLERHLSGAIDDLQSNHKEIQQLKSDISGCIKLIAKYEAERIKDDDEFGPVYLESER